MVDDALAVWTAATRRTAGQLMARWETHQTDGNAKRLYAYAEALGMSVAILNRPVDAAVGKFGITALVEVKRPGEKLRPNQQAFLDGWRGGWAIWRDETDVDATHEGLRLLMASKRTKTALACARVVMQSADDSAAYLSVPCTCGKCAVAPGRPKG